MTGNSSAVKAACWLFSHFNLCKSSLAARGIHSCPRFKHLPNTFMCLVSSLLLQHDRGFCILNVRTYAGGRESGPGRTARVDDVDSHGPPVGDHVFHIVPTSEAAVIVCCTV